MISKIAMVTVVAVQIAHNRNKAQENCKKTHNKKGKISQISRAANRHNAEQNYKAID